jgi:hypothetical protein
VLGEKDKQWYKFKNISFMSLHSFLKTYRTKNIHSILILDKIDYLDVCSLDVFKKQKSGLFSGSNLKGDDELYLAQVMGNLQYHLTTDWHDNYIDRNFLSQTSLSDDFIETFLSEYKKNPEKFNKEELKYIESITNQISFAIEKAFLSSKIEDGKRIQQELEFARKIQLNSLPQKQSA